MPSPFATVVTVSLEPIGRKINVPTGSSLQDALFAHGVEFACGGRGRCKGCRVKVISGHLPVTDDDARLLSRAQIEQGWRLSCRASATADLTLELAQWDSPILSDDTALAFVPRPGYGIAVDLGSTTIVAQLVSLETGAVLGVRSALNAQAKHGADIMSRIEFAAHDPEETLTRLIRAQIGGLVSDLLLDHPAAGEALRRVIIVGNTAMHHLFCGRSVEPLSHFPFETAAGGLVSLGAGELGWSIAPFCRVEFLPCLGSFVGSDILAGVLATRLHETEELSVFIDLGTNGEMVVGNRDRLLCASTAAGPAFEGARISMGMRAATGAISAVTVESGTLRCEVIGGGIARGICGSGLVDAVAAGLEIGSVQVSGRLSAKQPLQLTETVSLSQGDIRELQLAKGAIAAGVRLLVDRWGATMQDVRHVSLAGAFGNYINRASAWRIGLIDFIPEEVKPVGNTALLGAKLALWSVDPEFTDVRRRIEHVPLADEPSFQEVFVQEMAFPAGRHSSSARSA